MVGILLVILIGSIIWWVNYSIQKEKVKEKYINGFFAARTKEEKDLKEKQRSYRENMTSLSEESIGLFESLPNYLECAEKYLDLAEFNFSDGAFAPFWDSIEKAAKTLGYFDESVQHIKNNSSRYTKLLREYKDTPPQFPLSRQSVEKLDVGTATAEYMKAIVRTAQRNFQFATIYEQRKTNQVLVAGFANLAEALDQMTWKITESIDDLAGSVDIMTLTLNESLREIHSRVGDIVEETSQHHDELIEETSKGAAREEKVLEMLDNIQRGRRPS